MQRHHADVVIIGAGAAGLTAAMTAQAMGADVVVIDKAPHALRGGNSRVSGQIVFWPNDPGKARAYLRAMSEPFLDGLTPELLEVWAAEMHANRAWLEGLGMRVTTVQSNEYPDLPGSDCVEVLLHGEGPYGEARLWDQVIEPAFLKTCVPVFYDTCATRLLTRDGEVVGVSARTADGTASFHARRAVVLASGGFQNNQQMIRTYMSDLPYCYPIGSPYNTGDGIRMAMEVGANLWHMNNLAGPNLAFKSPDLEVCARLGAIKANSYLYVGRDGQRFVSEAPNFLVKDGKQHSPIKHGKIFRNGRYVQYPCPVPIYLIFDETVRKAGGLCSKAAGFAFGWDVIHGDPYAWSTDNAREVELGWIRRADSIDALASMLELPAGQLEKTVMTFNQGCIDGVDSEWGRHGSQMAPLVTPPFYAMELVPSSLNTQGGPMRNEHAQILDHDGRSIPRLYSAGELGSIYAYRYQAGGNLGECFAFGRVAGRNAAAEAARALDE